MKALFTCVQLLVAAAIGWWGGAFVVSEWVMPESLQSTTAETKDNGKGSGGSKNLRSERIAGNSARKGGNAAVAVKVETGEGERRRSRQSDLKVGPYRQGAVKVSDVRRDGSVETRRVDMCTARRELRATMLRPLRKRGKAPKEERDAQLTRDPFSSEEKVEKDAEVYPGDVFLTGIPMVDQGGKAYCAVASAARVLQSYGIEITMDDMAALAGSSEIGGTHPKMWANALGRVANSHGLELKTVAEVTESERPLTQLLNDYNQMARDMGYEELYTWDYANAFVRNYAKFDNDREYPVQREVMLSNERACDAFDRNVTERIDESDPLFWTVTLGDIPEKGVELGKHGSHMRLIIGYNEERGEVLYSDSWGEGHELKRMDGQDALSITRGMYYLTE